VKFIEKRVTAFLLLFAVVFLLAFALFPCSSEVHGRVSDESNMLLTQVPTDVNENQTVYIEIYLVDIYSFEYKTGSYTLDMYIYFAWIDPNINTADWYLMNGYPTYPGAKLLVEENKTGNVKWELYRVRANLNVPIEPTNYPFDRIKLPISIELLTHGYDTSLIWLDQETGIDPDFTNVGWNNPVCELNTSISHYPFEVSPRADMFVIQERNFNGAFMKTIFPPFIFCFVSAVCFLFKVHEDSALGLRVGIGTSMLISAVLFNIAEQNDIPPVTKVTFYSLFIAAVISFLALVLIVTVLGYVEWMRTQNKKHVEKLNRIGFVTSLAIPVLVFVTLFLSK
jgi:hypothetical protein